MDLDTARSAFKTAARASQDATLDHRLDPASLEALHRKVQARRDVVLACDRLLDEARHHDVDPVKVGRFEDLRRQLVAERDDAEVELAQLNP